MIIRSGKKLYEMVIELQNYDVEYAQVKKMYIEDDSFSMFEFLRSFEEYVPFKKKTLNQYRIVDKDGYFIIVAGWILSNDTLNNVLC